MIYIGVIIISTGAIFYNENTRFDDDKLCALILRLINGIEDD